MAPLQVTHLYGSYVYPTIQISLLIISRNFINCWTNILSIYYSGELSGARPPANAHKLCQSGILIEPSSLVARLSAGANCLATYVIPDIIGLALSSGVATYLYDS